LEEQVGHERFAAAQLIGARIESELKRFAVAPSQARPEAKSKSMKTLRPSRLNKAKLILIVSAVLWVSAVSVGLWIMWGYENSPGTAATPPALWPAESRIPRASDHATLIMMAHPQCSCTRASIGELALLMAQTQGRLTAYVLLLKPPGVPHDWEKTDLWNSAASIPGVHVLPDEDGIEAERFHAATSGQTLLYNKDGLLLFSGGITVARGHSGENAGRSAIVSLTMQGKAGQTETSVFGCPLFDPSSECRTGKGAVNHDAANN